MPQGRHRAESVKGPSFRLPRPAARSGVPAGAALVAVTLGVALWSNTDASSGDVAVTSVGGHSPDEAANHLAANTIDTDGGSESLGANGSGKAADRAEDLLLAASLQDRQLANRSAAPTASPSPSSEPSRAKAQPTPTAVGQKWTTTRVNVRSAASADQDLMVTLDASIQVGVTGATEDGWTQVITNKGAGWVKSTYLSASKPTPKPQPAPATKKAATAQPKPAAKKTRASAGVSTAPCSISSSIEPQLKGNARAVYRAVCAAYGGSVSSFGGLRPGDDGDHGTGRAVDIMVSGAPGWKIAKYVQAHARELGVTYVIYEQKIWMAGNPTSQWKTMSDRGGATANHYDHVHVSVS